MRIQSSLILIFLLLSTTSAEKQFQMKIGPIWPSALWDTEKPTAWDASMQTGSVFDDRVTIGGAIDFLWYKDVKELKTYSTNSQNSTISQVEVLQRTLMFPVTAFLSISPTPDLFVQPCFSGYVGLNTMYLSYKGDTIKIEPSSYKLKGSGWYMGLIWKIAGDAVIRLGNNSSLICGIEYQWTKPRKLGDNNGNLYIRRDMSGVGIRLGVKVSY